MLFYYIFLFSRRLIFFFLPFFCLVFIIPTNRTKRNVTNEQTNDRGYKFILIAIHIHNYSLVCWINKFFPSTASSPFSRYFFYILTGHRIYWNPIAGIVEYNYWVFRVISRTGWVGKRWELKQLIHSTIDCIVTMRPRLSSGWSNVAKDFILQS